MMTKTIVTLTGPTCTGKTTLQALLEARGLSGIVSFTTRQMRQGEIEGKDYYFLSEGKYSELTENDFVEQIQLNGNKYGILKREIERVLSLDKNIVVVVEPNGVKQVGIYCAKNKLKHIAVYVDNTEYVIYRRFLDRFYRDEKAVLDTYALRLSNLTFEMQTWRRAYPYNAVFSNFGPENQNEVVDKILNLTK